MVNKVAFFDNTWVKSFYPEGKNKEKNPKKHKKMIFFMKKVLKFTIWLCYNTFAVALTGTICRALWAR